MGPISAALLILALLACFYSVFCITSRIYARCARKRAMGRDGHDSIRRSVKESVLGIAPFAAFAERLSRKRRAEEFERGLPEVLRLLCTALESGASLTMALRYAAENCDEPLAGELKRTVWDLEAGQGFDDAIDNLRNRTGGAEFSYLAICMEIQHSSGGSLREILNSTAEMLKQSADLKEDLRTKTTQGRMSSKIVAIMPFALLAILSLFSPGYLSCFFESALGVLLFALALVLEAAGVVLVWRALKIDFSVDIEGGR